jgi:hypothetical protein
LIGILGREQEGSRQGTKPQVPKHPARSALQPSLRPSEPGKRVDHDITPPRERLDQVKAAGLEISDPTPLILAHTTMSLSDWLCLVIPAFRVRQFLDMHKAAAYLPMNRSRFINGYTRCDADCLPFQKPMIRGSSG